MAAALGSAPSARARGDRLRAWVRSALGALQRARCRALDAAELSAPAIVFAPHQDDETLGCGGTLLRKSAAGATVAIAFLTDGSSSHPQRMARAELAATRAREALAAARTLGVAEQDVAFLGAPDGALAQHAATAVPALRAILEERRPQQVFVPYARDRLADHVATRDLVVAALRQSGLAVDVFEYPVWFWNHWPWMRQTDGSRTGPRRFLRESLALLWELDTRVAVGEFRDAKLAALRCHATQMTHFDGSYEWLTLADVADGDFLRCLLTDHELFHRWSLR